MKTGFIFFDDGMVICVHADGWVDIMPSWAEYFIRRINIFTGQRTSNA